MEITKKQYDKVIYELGELAHFVEELIEVGADLNYQLFKAEKRIKYHQEIDIWNLTEKQ